MKKVLHISHSLETGGGPLAIQKAIDDIRNVEHYVAGNHGHFASLFMESLGNGRILLLRGKNVFSNVALIRSFIRKNRIDIIHCHGRGAGLYGRLVRLLVPRLKVVYTIHGFHPQTVKFPLRVVYLLAEKILLSLTNKIVFVSNSEGLRFVDAIAPKKEKVVTIPNYLRPGEIQFAPYTVKPQAPDRINILYVGRWSPEKGIDILIQAMTEVSPTVKLHIIGYGRLETWMREFIDGRLQGSVELVGKINNASSLMKNFDAVVIPSRYEGMPFVCLEAMLAERPIIATPAVGIIDLVTNQTAYLATDFSPRSLANAINNFASDCAMKKEVIDIKVAENYERLIRDFSISNIAKLEAVYENV